MLIGPLASASRVAGRCYVAIRGEQVCVLLSLNDVDRLASLQSGDQFRQPIGNTRYAFGPVDPTTGLPVAWVPVLLPERLGLPTHHPQKGLSGLVLVDVTGNRSARGEVGHAQPQCFDNILSGAARVAIDECGAVLRLRHRQ